MPRALGNRTAKLSDNSERPVGRPARFTPELATRVCGLIATGSTLRAAAKSCGVGWRTVARWNVDRPEFREAYEDARATRTLVWAEECVEIVDDATGDYAKPFIWTADPDAILEKVRRGKQALIAFGMAR